MLHENENNLKCYGMMRLMIEIVEPQQTNLNTSTPALTFRVAQHYQAPETAKEIQKTAKTNLPSIHHTHLHDRVGVCYLVCFCSPPVF
jgi:hypothetical protein